jgi:hypothetical protein
MPCHPPRYATISVPLFKTDAQEVIVRCTPRPQANLTSAQGFGSRMFGLARGQIGRLLTFVRRLWEDRRLQCLSYPSCFGKGSMCSNDSCYCTP